MNQAKNALWMSERGHSVWVLGYSDSLLHTYCKTHSLNFIPLIPHRKYFDFPAAFRLRKQLLNLNIQHLILRDVRDMSVSVAAKFWGKSNFKVHYFMEMQLGVSKKNLLHTIRFRLLDTWSCPLNWLFEQVNEKTFMPKNRIIQIPSALNRTPFLNEISKEIARKEFGIPSEGLVIGLAGRFDPQKGQLLLLEALSIVENKTINVLFLGDSTKNEGDEYSLLVHAKMNQFELENRCFIRPFRTDIEVFYKAIDVFIMASKCETVGMVTIESMTSGTPVIGSNAGGTKEILKNGTAGYLFEPMDEKSLAEKIETFIANPNQFQSTNLQNAVLEFDHHAVIHLVEERLHSFFK